MVSMSINQGAPSKGLLGIDSVVGRNPEHRCMDRPGLVRCEHLVIQSAVKHDQAPAKWRNHSGRLTVQIPWPLP